MSTDGILRGHDLFRSLGLEKAFAAKDFTSVKKYRAGETVFSYNDAAGHVYMLMTGGVELRLPSQHQNLSLVISTMEKGELFGLSPLLDSKRYTATAKCTEESELLLIEAKPFRELLKENSLVGFGIMNNVAHIYFNRYVNVLKNLQDVVAQISLIR